MSSTPPSGSGKTSSYTWTRTRNTSVNSRMLYQIELCRNVALLRAMASEGESRVCFTHGFDGRCLFQFGYSRMFGRASKGPEREVGLEPTNCLCTRFGWTPLDGVVGVEPTTFRFRV